MGKPIRLLKLIFIFCLFCTVIFPSSGQAIEDSIQLQKRYYQITNRNSLIYGSITGLAFGVPLLLVNKDAQMYYGLGACVTIGLLAKPIVKGVKKRAARKLNISAETTVLWDEVYPEWRKQKKQSKIPPE
jgi:uncharacterized membrane protein (UPF0136 family)